MSKPEAGKERRDTRLRFEQWARNPACEANTLSAVHGIPMVEVAKAEGGRITMGQSPFAIARGQTFERGLFRGAAEQIRKALVEAEVLDEAGRGFADFRIRRNSGKLPNLDAALQQTAEVLVALSKAKARDVEPSIMAAATIRIPERVMLPEAILIIDVLVVRWDAGAKRPELLVGEVKTYPDRGGHTDGAELATARAQAGVYLHGLEVTLASMGLAEKFTLSRKGFLVLTRPGSNFPSIRANEDLRYQARRAERGFNQLEAAANVAFEEHGAATVQTVLDAPTAYESACIGFCDRAATCFKRAMDAGNATILGEDVARFLGSVNLTRAMELLDGDKPRTQAERDLIAQLLPGESR
jgi:hypothetical protein